MMIIPAFRPPPASHKRSQRQGAAPPCLLAHPPLHAALPTPSALLLASHATSLAPWAPLPCWTGHLYPLFHGRDSHPTTYNYSQGHLCNLQFWSCPSSQNLSMALLCSWDKGPSAQHGCSVPASSYSAPCPHSLAPTSQALSPSLLSCPIFPFPGRAPTLAHYAQ